MTLVLPGRETGLYYVVLSGLSFDVKWKDLKDFLRAKTPPIEVDRAEAYQSKNKGGGWVRLRDLAMFRRAFDALNGGVIKGKVVNADARNETGIVVLHNLPNGFVNSALSSYGTQHQTSSPAVSAFSALSGHSSSPEWQANLSQSPVESLHPLSLAYPVETPVPQSVQSHDATSRPFLMQQPGATPYSIDLAGPAQTMMIPTQIHPIPKSQYLTPNFPQPFQFQDEYQQPQDMYQQLEGIYQQLQDGYQQSQLSESTQVLETEAKKVIVTRLPYTTTKKHLYNLLGCVLQHYQPMSIFQHPVQSIDLPTNSEGKLKGHALILLETYNLASLVIERLDGYSFQGRTLHVRFAKEGAEPSRNDNNPKISHRKALTNPTTDSMNHLGRKSSRSKGSPSKGHVSSSSSSYCKNKSSQSKPSKSSEKKMMVEPPPDRDISCRTPMVVDGSSGGQSRRNHDG